MIQLIIQTMIFFLMSLSIVIAADSRALLSGDFANSEYNKGKTILHKHLICDACPLAGTKLTRSTAWDIRSKLYGEKFELFTHREMNSMIFYLEYRFRLKD